MIDQRDDETLKPIAPREVSANASSPNEDFFSKLIFALSSALVIAALVGSAYAFAGFAENDQGIAHLLSALVLCFGLGALIFLPAALIAQYAKEAIHTPLSPIRVLIILSIVMPWLLFCYYLFKVEGLPRASALLGFFCTGLIAIWAARYLRR